MPTTKNTSLRNECEIDVTWQLTEGLKYNPSNARTHSTKQIAQIARSIESFGFNNPILIDERGNIIAGQGRVEAAKLLGLQEVPVISLTHMTEAQKRAYIIADNKIAEAAGWDPEILKIEFEYLTGLDIGFDTSVTGFEIPEIDLILQYSSTDEANDSEDLLEIPGGPLVSQIGDLWLLGNHRVYCGNSLDPNSYKTLMADEKAEAVFTDPPYNVPVDGHICGNGRIKHEEFAMASGEMSPEQFHDFLNVAFKNLISFSKPGSLHYICMDWRHMKDILDAANGYSELKNLCVWNKTNGGMGSLYRSKHELVFVFKNGIAQHINNIELGKFGRNRTNVWDYAGVNTFSKDRDTELSMHPTVKPVALIQDVLLDCTTLNGIVLDCFGGSGSTLMAAEAVGRQARLIEIDPKYVDVTLSRFWRKTGMDPINALTGVSFSQART